MNRLDCKKTECMAHSWFRTGMTIDCCRFSLGLGIVGALTALFCLPFLHSITWFGDEGILLHAADRMRRGEKLYVDFFEFLPPGGFIITLSWLGIAGVSFVSARLLAILVIVCIACLTYTACYRACRSVTASALTVVAWVVMSQGEWTQLSHHWFTTLFSVAVLLTLLKWIETPQRSAWLAIAGLLGGIAAMVTPTRGALVLVAGVAAFNGIRRQFGAFAVYCLTALLVPTLMVLYFAAHGSLGAAFDNVIIWPAKHYASIQWLHYGANPNTQNILLNLVFPLTALFVLLHVTRQWRAALNDRVLRVLIAFGCAGFLGFLVRADTIHIAYATPLVLPLLLRSTAILNFQVFRQHRASVLAALALLAIAPSWAFLIQAQLALRAPAVETPRGLVKLMTREAGAVEALRHIMDLPEGDAVFFYPNSPLLPFLTARVHPARVDIFLPSHTTPEQYEEACVSAMNLAAWVVIERRTMVFWQRIYPAMRNPAPPERIRLEAALNRGFSSIAHLGHFELRAAVQTKLRECQF